MQQVNRMYYAVMMLNMAAMATPGFRVTEADIDTRSFQEIRGEMAPVSSGKMRESSSRACCCATRWRSWSARA